MTITSSAKDKEVVECQVQSKELLVHVEDQGLLEKETDAIEDRVHIPKNFDDSEESETLSEKLRGIGAYTDEGQCSKQNENVENQQVWQMEIDKETEASEHILNAKLLEQDKGCSKTHVSLISILRTNQLICSLMLIWKEFRRTLSTLKKV